MAGGRGEDWQVSEEALWWPPSKVAGKYLAPYLAGHIEEMQVPDGGIGVEVRVDGDPVRRRPLLASDGGGRVRAIHTGGTPAS